jgi:hypothetical protein
MPRSYKRSLSFFRFCDQYFKYFCSLTRKTELETVDTIGRFVDLDFGNTIQDNMYEKLHCGQHTPIII